MCLLLTHTFLLYLGLLGNYATCSLLDQIYTETIKTGKNINKLLDKKQQSSEIMKLLPPDYDKNTYPPKEHEDMVNKIGITIDIFSIPHLDEKEESIMIEVRVSHMWTDLRLNTSQLKQPVDLEPGAIRDFWTPDSYFHHAKDSKTVQLMTPTASLQIRPDKQIKYSMMMMLTLGCPMSFQIYPMDHQTCRLELQSFGYSLKYNNYTWRRSPHIMNDINLDNHEVTIKEYTFTYTSEAGLSYPGLGVRIELRRHLGFHMTQTYIPSVIFVFVAWMSFHVPSDVVPGRMVLCVTTLLTLTSMFNSVRSLTPQVSYMKAIDLWVFVCIMFVFGSLAEFGVILFLTSRSVWQKKVDSHIRSVTNTSRLLHVHPLQMISISGSKDEESKNEAEANKPNNTSENPLGSTSIDDVPRYKLRLAYSIEWCTKILYPLSFFLFNIIYWSYYLSFVD